MQSVFPMIQPQEIISQLNSLIERNKNSSSIITCEEQSLYFMVLTDFNDLEQAEYEERVHSEKQRDHREYLRLKAKYNWS